MSSNILKLKMYRQQGREDRDRIILEHLPQIKYIARRIAFRLPPGVQLDDLISAGILGLMDALEKFDESKGVQFKTYAEVRIRGAILDSLRGLDWAPRSLRKRSRSVEEAYTRLEQKLGRSASDAEAAEDLGLEINEFHALLDQLQGLNIGQLQTAGSDRESSNAEEMALHYLPLSEEESPFETVQKRELREILAGIIRALPEKEQLVVSLYYYEELTMKEIGEILGVNESRVSQLHTRAMLRMRGKLQAMLKNKRTRTHG